MGRKKCGQNLGRIMLKDVNALSGLSNCGRFKNEHFNSFNVPDSRVRKYQYDKLIEKKIDKNGESIYGLTKKGRELVEKETGNIFHYKGQGRNGDYRHDLLLADKYCSLSTEQQSSFMNESELSYRRELELEQLKKDNWDEYIKRKEMNVSPIDGCYTNENGVTIAIEIVSRHYTEEMITQKQEFCEDMNIEYQGFRC